MKIQLSSYWEARLKNAGRDAEGYNSWIEKEDFSLGYTLKENHE